MSIDTYSNSYNTPTELNFTIFEILNYLDQKNEIEQEIYLILSAFQEFFLLSTSKQNNNNKISQNTIEIIKKTKINEKLKQSILNGVNGDRVNDLLEIGHIRNK
jgi:hypothetical protein